MTSEFKKRLYETEYYSEYDEAAKRLLSQKIILARILVNVVDELKGVALEDVISLIEGEPVISKVSVDSGLTNKHFDENIHGMNTEDFSVNEGLIRFDIIFYVRLADGLSEIIVNIEIQRKEPYEYDILNRAIFYASRMISSQKDRDFQNSEYNDIKRVYTIWICLKTDESCTSLITLNQRDILGHHSWKGDLGLVNIVMIGVPDDLPSDDENYELHRFLHGLLSNKYSFEEKQEILKGYKIDHEEDVVREVQTMCNLSLGIREDAIEEGIAKGLAKGREEGREEGMAVKSMEVVKNMLNDKMPYETIAKYTGLTIEQIEEIEKTLFVV